MIERLWDAFTRGAWSGLFWGAVIVVAVLLLSGGKKGQP